uniref:Prolyl 4-hydroxylase alpha subunit domain-containing protein n=1 Tax=Leptocylindrus danicus TaxID=163516 RepID=A0A7S2LKZ5_9STRA|mmetsp:Transcript_6990/g.10439  ORF Transcript_6990/g.10439 Transcript_6990/m.10439 type:complete len:436 (+) Transcript_6990:297-1604(+)|eukprot:CAMPEP_0116025206 /NCGR_PEP_ID=MMETSP0321-20121206/12886_1 /TAXON_ID=163516 /ORGANISM="Leptocylindrus danicus var. danicus, Strain B650" /LENGTH=435 /DNA_ID=CAMNT_0003497307 /DNA_START=248 /DNA_END=1555 /DNA_ORIENTATION=-
MGLNQSCLANKNSSSSSKNKSKQSGSCGVNKGASNHRGSRRGDAAAGVTMNISRGTSKDVQNKPGTSSSPMSLSPPGKRIALDVDRTSKYTREDSPLPRSNRESSSSQFSSDSESYVPSFHGMSSKAVIDDRPSIVVRSVSTNEGRHLYVIRSTLTDQIHWAAKEGVERTYMATGVPRGVSSDISDVVGGLSSMTPAHSAEAKQRRRVMMNVSSIIPQANQRQRGIAGRNGACFTPESINLTSHKPVELVCLNEDSRIFACDIGLTKEQCDTIISTSEKCSKGSYAAYTYAKQTIGCREHDDLANVCEAPVMIACKTIMYAFEQHDLVLDDREPHIVKYDISKKERQKLDMHTDKSEWTFLIALSEGQNEDFCGGGTFFEDLDSTIHLQRGQAIIFPGKLRHKGQKITKGTRFLLVGFLVDKPGKESESSKDGTR